MYFRNENEGKKEEAYFVAIYLEHNCGSNETHILAKKKYFSI